MKLWAEEYKKKVIPPDQLKRARDEWKKEKKSIATVNGSFDLLHAGHLQILFEASQLADILLVALNSDNSIKKYKSPNRPLIPLEYRLQMIAAIRYVDAVTWFEETDPIALLSVVQPDWHVNGAEYGKECIESATVLANGGQLHIVELIPGLSTTAILQKITERAKV